MATATDPTYSIRQGLLSKGVNAGDIGYKNGYVTVGGNNFMKPSKVLNGASYDTQQNFNSAWDTYQKSRSQTPTTATTSYTGPSYTPNASTAPTTTYSPYTTNNPYDSQYNDLLSTLLKQSQNQQPVSVDDIYNSPQWAAYQASAQRQAQQGIRAAQESLGAAGFGRSTALAERAQDYQNDANNYLQTQVLPQLMASAQNDRQQQLQNQLSLLNQLQSAQGVYDNRYNNAQNNAIQRGELTGNYLPPEAQALISDILSNKTAYANASDATARQQANAQANADRAQLAAMGINPDLFGSGVTLSQAQANLPKAGTQTLAAQNQKFDQDVTMAQLTGYLPDGTPTTAQQQQQLANLWTLADSLGVIPDQLADLYGLPHGTQTFTAKQAAIQNSQNQQQIGISAMNARTSASSAASSASNARFNQLMDVWQATGVAPSGLEAYGIRAGTPLPQQSSSSGPTANDVFSEAITNLDQMTPDQRKNFFKGEKSNIVKQLGINGYNQLYGQYFDENGDPIQ